MNKTLGWLRAFRIKTLVAAVVPVMVAHCLVLAHGIPAKIWITLYALGGAIAIQIATNLFNDILDFKKGADGVDRIGPQRMSQSGGATLTQLNIVALFFLSVAVFFGFSLVWEGGLPILFLGICSLFLAYGYTGGPFPLAYLGLGDLFVIIFFGLFAVGGTYFIHTKELHSEAMIAGLQVGFLATVLLAINNLRDSSTDKLVNKNTLAVRFGDNFVRWEIGLLIAGVFLLSFFYSPRLMPWFSFGLVPLALFILWHVFQLKDKRGLNGMLAKAALLQLLFGLTLSLDLIF